MMIEAGDKKFDIGNGIDEGDCIPSEDGEMELCNVNGEIKFKER